MDKFRVAEMARKYTEYDMIQAHTKLPDYPDSRTKLLVFFLNGDRDAARSSELFALVASLVQMGLDTHELIGDRNEISTKRESFRSVQLKVLAGDYFSSRFYQLLAQEGRIDLIGKLSDAICEVNRLKMNLYEMMKHYAITPDEYAHSMVKINTELYLSLGGLMEGMYRTSWPDMLHSFAYCELLVDEIARCRGGERFFGGWGFWHLLHEAPYSSREQLRAGNVDQARLSEWIADYDVVAKLLRFLELQVKSLHEQTEKLAAANMTAQIRQLLQPFHDIVARPTVPEEI